MKLKYEFEMIEMDNMIVAVPIDNEKSFSGIIKLNESAAAVFELLKKECTEKEIVDTLVKEYVTDREQIASYVHNYIGHLKEDGILI